MVLFIFGKLRGWRFASILRDTSGGIGAARSRLGYDISVKIFLLLSLICHLRSRKSNSGQAQMLSRRLDDVFKLLSVYKLPWRLKRRLFPVKNLFELTRREQRAVISVMIALVAGAVAKRYRDQRTQTISAQSTAAEVSATPSATPSEGEIDGSESP